MQQPWFAGLAVTAIALLPFPTDVAQYVHLLNEGGRFRAVRLGEQ